MSNLINQNPLILDTGAATIIVSSYLEITNIRWVDYNNDIADGDQVVLKNDAGEVIWESRVTATGAGVPLNVMDGIDFASPFIVKGLIATTVTHGKVYIYCTKSTRIPCTA